MGPQKLTTKTPRHGETFGLFPVTSKSQVVVTGFSPQEDLLEDFVSGQHSRGPVVINPYIFSTLSFALTSEETALPQPLP